MAAMDCSVNRDLRRIGMQGVVSVLGVIMVLTLIPPYIKFIVAQIRGELKISKLTFLSGLTLFTLVFAVYALVLLNNLTNCTKNDTGGVGFTMSAVFNSSVQLGVVGVLYHRLVSIFKDTALKLGKCVIVSFWITYCIAAVLELTAGVLYTVSPELSVELILLAGMLVLFLIFWMAALFIFKLCKVYRNVPKENGARLLQVITKNCILAIVSTSLTFASFVVAGIQAATLSYPVFILFALVVLFDLYTNFICIMLTYSYFTNYYQSLCGGLDKWCNRTMTERVMSKEDQASMAASAIEPQTAASAGSSQSEIDISSRPMQRVQSQEVDSASPAPSQRDVELEVNATSQSGDGGANAVEP
eukprot:CAMPEP_0202686678 /NCGR_PEP_ID=MMETSP1385-20130828/2435_1 /ASSEMBLY_ACC=CAM_ASM_000861 /TAXON_ID=933848 /ORGANISM="Elphidium margaritaceum" /LENGTH=358 /DNA_ID=CAMNT_0049341307 /DNA_START=25 /DNA_END=1101 /DNA_ORIENTATION=+